MSEPGMQQPVADLPHTPTPGVGTETQPINFLEYWKAGVREVTTFRGHSREVWCVAFSSDQRTLASGGCDRLVRMWDIETGRLLRSLRGHTNDIRGVQFTPDGSSLITGSEDRTIRIWNPTTGEPTKLLFARYDHAVCSISLSPDGLMLARGGHNKDVKIWEVTTGTELMTLLGKDQFDHHWSVCVAFSPDGIHLASGYDIGKIKLWEVLPNGEEKVFHAGHWREPIDEDDSETRGYFVDDQLAVFQKPMEYWIGAMTFSPDGKILITASRDATIKFYHVPELKEFRTLKGHSEWIRSLAISPDGRVLASASDDKTVKFWDISSGRHFTTIKGHSDGVRGIAFSPDGLRLASGSSDRTVKLWEGGPQPAGSP